MAIQYFVDMSCPPRNEIGAEELPPIIRDLTLARSIEAAFVEKQGNDFPRRLMKFKRRFTTESGEEIDEELSVAKLLEVAEPLHPLAMHCVGCPASVTGKHFGCVQSLSLPISTVGERWLLSQVKGPKTLSGQLFRQSAEHLSYGDCEKLTAWRRAGFLESAEAPRRHDDGDAGPITSDAILHPMLMVGDLGPSHCLSLLLFTNALTTTDGGDTDEVIKLIERIQVAGETADSPGLVFSIKPNPKEDRTVTELKMFLMACYLGFSLQVPLAIRM